LKFDLLNTYTIKQLKILGYLLFCIFTILSATSREYLGDVNQDGEIDVLDIVRIVNIILENDPPPTEYELWASDVNVDESTDVIDIIIIVQVIIGNDDCPYLYSQCSDNFSDCCVDTTSHFVELQIDTLGVVGGFSSLSDVAIINENNIWVRYVPKRRISLILQGLG
jgi:hypothetical protein